MQIPQSGAFLLAIRRRRSHVTRRADTTPRPGPTRAEIAAQRAAGADQVAMIRAAWDVLVAEYLPHLPGGAMTRDDRAGLIRVLARELGLDVATVQVVLK